MEHSFPLLLTLDLLSSILVILGEILERHLLRPTLPHLTPLPRHNSSQLDMMDRIGSSTSSVDLMGKLSVRVLDSVCLLFIHRE